MKFPQNPIPERAPCCFRFITKQLLNHAPWWKTKHKTLPWTLNTSCSCLICDSIWLFSRICFSFPQGSQLCAVSTCLCHSPSFTKTSANICNLGFSTYPSTTNHDEVWSTTIILGICVHYQTFLFKNSQDTFHLQKLAPQLVLQLLQRLQKRVPGDGANCSNVKFS